MSDGDTGWDPVTANEIRKGAGLGDGMSVSALAASKEVTCALLVRKPAGNRRRRQRPGRVVPLVKQAGSSAHIRAPPP
jgi:hypothetical protein